MRSPTLPKEGTRTPEPNLGTLLYLISLGVVAIATVAVFFGPGFFLLARPDEELIADARDRGVEVAPQHADLVSPPNKDAAPFPAQTAPAPSVPPEPSPETHEVSPPASKDAALGTAIAADTGAANATFYGSSSQEQPGLRSNVDEATLATPTGVTHAAAHHRMAARTGSTANRLNQEELARLQSGSSMPPPAAMGAMPPPGPNAQPVRGKQFGISWPGAWTFRPIARRWSSGSRSDAERFTRSG